MLIKTEIAVDERTIKKLKEMVKTRNEILGDNIDYKSILSELLDWDRVRTAKIVSNSGITKEIHNYKEWVDERNKRIEEIRAFTLKCPEFSNVFNIVKDKREELFRLIREEYNNLKSCKKCKKTCCCREYGYFEKGDLIYYALNDKRFHFRKEILINRIKRGNRGCVFLSETGCVLEYDLRPTTCVVASCYSLSKELEKNKKSVFKIEKLRSSIRAINSLAISLQYTMEKLHAYETSNTKSF